MVLMGLPSAALAEEAVVAYQPAQGEEFISNLAGVFYIGLVAVFLFRVLSRRAKRAREQRIGGPQPGEQESFFDQLRKKFGADVPPPSVEKLNPIAPLLGAVQAGGIFAGLLLFSTKVQGSLDNVDLPDAYTARNISVTVRTIIIGLSYLATFIFGANAVGLFGLFLQALLFPDSLRDDPSEAAARQPSGPQLPKVVVTAKGEDVRRAFELAERMGKNEASASINAASTESSSSGSSGSSSSSSGASQQ